VSEIHDVCIVGAGGVVGIAIARELARKRLSVVGLEKHPASHQETSGRNSRVIHSGFHEVPGTLKARLASEGSRLIAEYARLRDIGFLETGMLIAVPRGAVRQGLWRDVFALWNILRGGRAQSIPFKFILTGSGIREVAPIEASGGIFIPSVGVIDLEAFMYCLEQDALAAGSRLLYSSEVHKIDVRDSSYVVATTGEEIQARILINSAGLYANDISRMAGGPEYPIDFIRGEYYEILGGTGKWNIKCLVYPAMPPRSPSKGIHLGPRPDGRLFIGPNAYKVEDRTDYNSKITPREVFLQAARRFMLNLNDSDLRWAYSGIRPKASVGKGKPDFIIRLDRNGPPLINLVGIDSPGLSSSMAIAKYVGEIVGNLCKAPPGGVDGRLDLHHQRIKPRIFE
jgi:glycerol-3-phosphate dehydrogenase